jgi:hypothetical protein
MDKPISPFRKAFEEKALFKEVVDKVIETEKQEQLEKERLEKRKQENLKLQHLQDHKDREEYSKFKQHIIDMQYITAPDRKQTCIEKGTAKLFHIICSHIPFSKSERVWSLEGKQKNCCFCGTEIISLIELMQSGGDVLLKSVQAEAKAYTEGLTTQAQVEASKEVLIKAYGDRKIGYTSDETTTVICAPCFKQFGQWIQNECLSGNRLVNSAFTKMRFGKNENL